MLSADNKWVLVSHGNKEWAGPEVITVRAWLAFTREVKETAWYVVAESDNADELEALKKLMP